jgi:TP901-1 family phage major tail protein
MAQPTTAKFGKLRILLGMLTPAAPVTVTSLSNANPAMVTVGAGDFSQFQDGETVIIAGATGVGMVNANGSHTISNVVSNTFTLDAVDTSAGSAPQTSGVTAQPEGAAPIIYAAPCGLTSKSFSITKNLQEIDIPDCDDPDAVSWIGRDAQNLSANVSGDGVAAAESVPDWQDAAISTDSVPMKIEIEFTSGTKTFEGYFQVDNLTFAAEQGGRVTMSFTAQSDGEIAHAWTPTP